MTDQRYPSVPVRTRTIIMNDTDMQAHVSAAATEPTLHASQNRTHKSRRAVRWIKKATLCKSGDIKKQKEKKRGATLLHTSQNKHNKSFQGSPNAAGAFTGPGANNQIEDVMSNSFHSCYSYERAPYEWWWAATAAEVLRSYVGSVTCKVESHLRPYIKFSGISTYHSTLPISTPRMPTSTKNLPGSDFASLNGEDLDFWKLGFSYVKPSGYPILRQVHSLRIDFPDARCGIFCPPISEVALLGWSELEESAYEFPSLASVENIAGGVAELVILGCSMRGHWITMMNRCTDIDKQFAYMTIAYMKRSILSRIAIPLTMFLEGQQDNGSFENLHTWIHTPIGLRHISWSTTGEISIDNDPDCGEWHGLVRVVPLYIPSMDRTVRALQRVMKRPIKTDTGITMETRCVLPDFQEGRVMFFQIDTYPNAFQGDFVGGAFHTSRVLKFEHPVDNVKEMSSKTALTEAGALKGCNRLIQEQLTV